MNIVARQFGIMILAVAGKWLDTRAWKMWHIGSSVLYVYSVRGVPQVSLTCVEVYIKDLNIKDLKALRRFHKFGVAGGCQSIVSTLST